MKAFLELVDVKPGAQVLDLGGAPAIWEHVVIPLQITLLNLPKAISPSQQDVIQESSLSHHKFQLVEGDACNVVQFAGRSFDVVFSNSVIEHVGPAEKQAEFAREARRLGKAYWVQTPSKWFPIEAHTGLPFYWFYPKWVRDALMRRWRKRLPAWWADYISTTRVLSRRRMAELFPDGKTRAEYFLGFPKSYVAHSRTPSSTPVATAAES